MNHFTYLKPKSIEEIFKDKSNYAIQYHYMWAETASVLDACALELLRRNASESLKILCNLYPYETFSCFKRLQLNDSENLQIAYFIKTIEELIKNRQKKLMDSKLFHQ